MSIPLRVLILEDNPDDAELALIELRRAGFDPDWKRVETATDYLAHLDLSLDLILADYRLPNFDGVKALELLQTRKWDIPFILVSGAIGEELAVAAMQRGAADYLLKDRMARLGSAVTNALQQKQLRDEERQAQERMCHAEEKYRGIFENAVEGIFQSTPEGQFLTANPALARMLGYSSPEELITTITDLARLLHVDPTRRAELQLRLEEEGVVHDFEAPFYRKDGSVISASVNAHVVRDDNGAVLYYEGTTEDITERKRAEEELRESNRRLEKALQDLQQAQSRIVEQERLRALGEMASGIAHDFNNALGPILGFTELLLMQPENLDDRDKLIRYLELMNTSAKDAASVVGRLREFYRHRDEGELFFPLNLNRLIEQAVSLTRPRWRDQALASGRTINIETQLGKVPIIHGNEPELREVLTNLIFNAIDAMPQGGTITLGTNVEGGHAIIEVRDAGTGMTEEVRQQCLEPFFSTKGEHGSGLGLSMVHGIVRRHDGTIQITSEWGKGTTFIIRLPMVTAHGAEKTIREPDVVSRRLRILVAEDDLQLREVLAAYLIADGHTVETVINGREALEKFHAGRFDLIVTDRAMPEMNGDQLAATIKQLSPRKPIIMLTGFGELMNSAGEEPEGVDLIVSKPVTLSALRQAVVKVLQ